MSPLLHNSYCKKNQLTQLMILIIILTINFCTCFYCSYYSWCFALIYYPRRQILNFNSGTAQTSIGPHLWFVTPSAFMIWGEGQLPPIASVKFLFIPLFVKIGACVVVIRIFFVAGMIQQNQKEQESQYQQWARSTKTMVGIFIHFWWNHSLHFLHCARSPWTLVDLSHGKRHEQYTEPVEWISHCF